jgi:hypothetical protein
VTTLLPGRTRGARSAAAAAPPLPGPVALAWAAVAAVVVSGHWAGRTMRFGSSAVL